MNKTTAFIWKESVYKNAFTCECGNNITIRTMLGVFEEEEMGN